jgi:hypothetical protein
LIEEEEEERKKEEEKKNTRTHETPHTLLFGLPSVRAVSIIQGGKECLSLPTKRFLPLQTTEGSKFFLATTEEKKAKIMCDTMCTIH